MRNLLKHDMRWGILNQWKLYLIFALFVALCCMRADGAARAGQLAGVGGGLPGFGDYMMKLFEGMKPFDPSVDKAFQFPLTYVGICLAVTFLIGYYPMQDLERQGIQRMLRTGSRVQWMLGKMIWNAAAVACLFLILWGVCGLFALPGARLDVFPALTALYGESGATRSDVLWSLLGMPFLVMLAAAQLEMVLALWVKPVFACAFTFSYLFVAGYIMHPAFLGNYFMFQRSCWYMKDGLLPWPGVLLCGGITIGCAVFSLLGIRKKNLL